MKKTTIQTSWHKATDSFTNSKRQSNCISSLRTKGNSLKWPINSTENVIRFLTKSGSFRIKDVLRMGYKLSLNKS